ncbi:MAG: CDP-glycerol glycerophosphotransferase family protein [Eubacterium sp.]|nr:CDP-glycerol glycerophosphotransferase family protein [Eubacterium sp.]
MAEKFTRIIVIEEDTINVGATGIVPAICGACDSYELDIIIYDTVCNIESSKWKKRLIESIVSASSENVKVSITKMIEAEGESRMSCFNKALEEVTDGYIQFSRPGVKADSGNYAAAFKAIAETGVDMVSYWPFQEVDGKRINQIYFSDFDRVFDSSANPFHISLTLDACIMKREAVGDIRFDEGAHTGEELFLLKVYEKIKNYYILREKVLITDYLANDFYNYRPMYEKSYYTPELRDYYIPLLKEQEDSPVIQGGVLELIQLMIAQNANDRNKNIIMGEEVDEYIQAMSDCLRLMDDEVIVQYKWTHRRTVPRFMSIKYLRLKYNDMGLVAKSVKSEDNPKEWLAEVKGLKIESFEKAVVNFRLINYDGKELTIEGELANVYYADFDKLKLEVCFGKNRIPVERTYIYTNIRHFGRTTKKGYSFKAVIPVEKLKAKDKLYFEYSYDGASVRTGITFLSFQSRLSNKLPESYWIFGKRILSFDEKHKQMIVEPLTTFGHMKRELKMMYRVARDGRRRVGKKKTLEMLRLRTAVKWSRGFGPKADDSISGAPKNKKPIWITYDQLFKGGDNGQYFYEYMNKNVNDIETCYIINKDSKEYKELSRKYKTALPFNTYKTRLKCLKSDMLFATRIDIRLYMGFTENDEIYVRDLFKADVVCLQHGLTIQKIAQYQNKFYDNTKHYYCVSPKEVENIKKPIYGYTDDMITLTGAPRYDGLVGEPKKQILITPTWRRNVTAGTNEKGKQHEYSVNFKRTTYYKIYNSLINDKRLIDSAKKNGYRIVYLVHPILSPQAGDFDKNDFVDIVPGVEANYEKMLKESALMVTDYSGIQFDFAYMRRPLVYFHPAELPPQYAEEDTGFGPICRTNDELIDELIKAMESDCRLEEEYKKNINAFFPFDDQNACKRVYEAAK